MRRRTAVLLLCVGLLAAPSASAKDDDAGWQSVKLACAAPKLLSDLRSPTVPHEHRVSSGSALGIGPEMLGLTLSSGGRRVDWHRTMRPDDAPKVSLRGSFELPGVLVLPDVHDRRYPLYLRASEDGKAMLVSSAFGLALPLVRGTGYLVDSDRDGVLGSEGDGYVAPESRTVGPWSGEGWTRRGGVRFEPVERRGWRQATVTLPRPKDKDHCAAWCLLQWRRQQCGVLPVGYDRALESAMNRHADYLHRNGAETHEENPRGLGYSPEGDRAGRSSILGFGDKSILAATEMQFGTLYHRTRPLQPGLTHTAIVFRHGIYMLNVFERRGGPLANALLVYPPHGMENVRLSFHPEGENPMPVMVTRSAASRLGTPVNVFSEPLRMAESLRETPRLDVVAGKRRRAVEAHFHFPGNSPSTRAGPSNRGNVARIPTAWLRPRTRYETHARVLLPSGQMFEYRWWFETARR